MIAGVLLGLVMHAVPVGAGRFELRVRGRANSTVALRATRVPSGWVASFCTRTLCSPFSFDVPLNARGAGEVELRLVRTSERAVRTVRAVVRAGDAPPLVVRWRAP